jgi:hypothetical protein
VRSKDRTVTRILKRLDAHLAKRVPGWSYELTDEARAVFEEAELAAKRLKVDVGWEAYLYSLLKCSRRFRGAVNANGGNATTALRVLRREMSRLVTGPYYDGATFDEPRTERGEFLDRVLDATAAGNRKTVTDADVALGLLATHDANFPLITNTEWTDKRLHTPFNLLAHIAGRYHPSLNVVFAPLYIALSDASATARRLKIFVCYAKEDRERVRKVVKRVTELGHEVWFDDRSVRGGRDWRREITVAIRRSDVVLACLSTRSVAKRGFVQKELRISVDAAEEQPEGSVFIVPLRFDVCHVPQRLDDWQWIDLFARDGFRRLQEALSDISNRSSPA